jgi:hypothetical protein
LNKTINIPEGVVSSDIEEELKTFLLHLNKTNKFFKLNIDNVSRELNLTIDGVIFSKVNSDMFNYQTRKVLMDVLKNEDKILT